MNKLEARITIEESGDLSRIIVATNMTLVKGDMIEYVRLAAGIILKALEAANLTPIELTSDAVVDLLKVQHNTTLN